MDINPGITEALNPATVAVHYVECVFNHFPVLATDSPVMNIRYTWHRNWLVTDPSTYLYSC